MTQPVTKEHASADCLAAALGYAERGWPVLPLHSPVATKASGCSCQNPRCKSPGKHPRTRNGVKDATTDEAQIRKWWAAWPGANVGIATGGGLVVLDVDPRNGGDDSLRELLREHGQPLTLCVRTGSGGLHLYFRAEGSFRSRNGLRPGLDVKADGGYVVAPPSLHVSGRYEVIRARDVVPAPEWFLGMLESNTDKQRTTALTPEQLKEYEAPSDDPEDRIRFTRMAVDRIVNDARFSDRNKWAGMAHAIRASCGVGYEEEAFEIFDDFTQRWTEGDYDPDETRRVWDTLPPSRNPGGHRFLVSLAYGDDHWAMPLDHPWRADNAFEAIEEPPTPLVVSSSPGLSSAIRVIEQLRQVPWDGLRVPLAESRRLIAALPPDELMIAQVALEAALTKRCGSRTGAQRLLAVGSSAEDPTFEVVQGKPLLRLADPGRLEPGAEYLVEGLIRSGAVGEVIADYSTGKTWVLTNLGLSVGFGVPFLGHVTRERPVLYLAYEGQSGLWRRLGGWLHTHEYLPSEFTAEQLRTVLENRFAIAQAPPTFDHPRIEEGLAATIQRLGAQLVVVDTRTKSLSAEQAEDAADTANHVNAMLSRLAHAIGCTTISAHHTGYAAPERGRGSSAWTQGTDFAFVIGGRKEDLAAGRPMSLRAIKMRDDEMPLPVQFRLRPVDGLAFAGTPWKSAVVESAESPPALSLRAQAFLHIEDNPGCTKTQLRVAMQRRHEFTDGALLELFEMGAIEDLGRSNRSAYHVRAGWRVGLRGDVEHPGDGFEASAREGATG